MEASTPAPAPKQMTLADVMAGEEEGDDPLKLPRASACDGLSWLFPGAARGRASGKLLFLDCDGVLNTTDAVDRAAVAASGSMPRLPSERASGA